VTNIVTDCDSSDCDDNGGGFKKHFLASLEVIVCPL